MDVNISARRPLLNRQRLQTLRFSIRLSQVCFLLLMVASTAFSARLSDGTIDANSDEKIMSAQREVFSCYLNEAQQAGNESKDLRCKVRIYLACIH